MSRITNENLVIEAIRRSRWKEGDSEGSEQSSVHSMLKGWMKPAERFELFKKLLADGTIVFEYGRYKRQRGVNGSALVNKHGLITNFPTDMNHHYSMSRFATSTKGKLLKRRSGGGVNFGSVKFYETYACIGIYVSADGIPGKVPDEDIGLW